MNNDDEEEEEEGFVPPAKIVAVLSLITPTTADASLHVRSKNERNRGKNEGR